MNIEDNDGYDEGRDFYFLPVDKQNGEDDDDEDVYALMFVAF